MTNHEMQNQMKSIASTLNEVMSILQKAIQKSENQIYDEMAKLEHSPHLVGSGNGRTD